VLLDEVGALDEEDVEGDVDEEDVEGDVDEVTLAALVAVEEPAALNAARAPVAARLEAPIATVKRRTLLRARSRRASEAAAAGERGGLLMDRIVRPGPLDEIGIT